MKPEEIKQSLLSKNKLYLGGQVNSGMVEYIGISLAELTSRDSPPITVHISSNGGDVRAGLDIYDMLSVYPNKIDGIVVSYARSMAVVILQACTKRLALEHSRILIHHISSQEITLDTMRSKKKKLEVLAGMEKRQSYLYRILSARSHKSIKQISDKCKEDEDMTVQEAVDFGLIDGIVPRRDDLK